MRSLTAFGLIAAEALYQNQRDEESKVEKIETEKPPPWVNAVIHIPKAIRKGKSYEEILEIKKQIWLKKNK